MWLAFALMSRYHLLHRVMVFLWFFVNCTLRYLLMSVVFMLGVCIRGILSADFAVWSASSLPFILAWPGIHINVIFGARVVISDLIVEG